MTKSFAIFTSTLGLSLSFQAQNAHADQEQLRLYVWEDSLSMVVKEQWENENQISLNLHYFDNDDERNKLMLDSNQLPFDIVVFDNVSANIYGSQGSLEDISNLPNRKHLDPRWAQACGDYAVPYFWGVLGIAYRQSKFAVPPTSWRDLVMPKDEIKGHVGLLQDTVETFVPALLTLGYPMKTDSTQQLREAYKVLREMQPNILTYEYPISYVRSHDDSDQLYMAMAYSGDQYSMNQYLEEEDWQFIVPNEGTYIWVDCLAINSASSHKKSAKKLLNDLMDPTIAATNALEVMVATPNRSAMALLPNFYTQDRTLFPSQEIIEKSLIDSGLSPSNINLRAKIINNVVNSHEAK